MHSYHCRATVLKKFDASRYTLRVEQSKDIIVNIYDLSFCLNNRILCVNDVIILHIVYHDNGVYFQVYTDIDEFEFLPLNNFDNLTI